MLLYTHDVALQAWMKLKGNGAIKLMKKMLRNNVPRGDSQISKICETCSHVATTAEFYDYLWPELNVGSCIRLFYDHLYFMTDLLEPKSSHK